MFNYTNNVQKDWESYQAILLKGKQSMIGCLSISDNTRSNLIVDPISFKLHDPSLYCSSIARTDKHSRLIE